MLLLFLLSIKMVCALVDKVNAGVVLNVYEAVDVLALIQDETYENLRLMVKDALYLRSDNVSTPYTQTNPRNLRVYSHVHQKTH